MACTPERKIRWDLNNIESRLCTIAKSRAKKKNIEFDLKKEDVVLPEYCPVLGVKLKTNMHDNTTRGMNDSYSIDRIDATRGYTKENIQVISHKANSMKRDANREELIKFAKWVLNTYLD